MFAESRTVKGTDGDAQTLFTFMYALSEWYLPEGILHLSSSLPLPRPPGTRSLSALALGL